MENEQINKEQPINIVKYSFSAYAQFVIILFVVDTCCCLLYKTLSHQKGSGIVPFLTEILGLVTLGLGFAGVAICIYGIYLVKRHRM